jgi:hypothetical protein
MHADERGSDEGRSRPILIRLWIDPRSSAFIRGQFSWLVFSSYLGVLGVLAFAFDGGKTPLEGGA